MKIKITPSKLNFYYFLTVTFKFMLINVRWVLIENMLYSVSQSFKVKST